MSVNAQKRLLILLRSTGDRETDTRKIRSVNTLIASIHARFPDRSYNFGTLVLYLERLRSRGMVGVVHRHGELRYHLTLSGFDEANRLWAERGALGYFEPALMAVSTPSTEFLSAPI